MSNYSPLFAGFPQPPSIGVIQANGIGASIPSTIVPLYGLYLVNKAPADNKNVQISPPIIWECSGLNTTNNSPQTIQFRTNIVPVNAATNPQASWNLYNSINNGGLFSSIAVFTPTSSLGNNLVSYGSFGGTSFQAQGAFTIADATGATKWQMMVSSSGEARSSVVSGGYFPTFYSNGSEAFRVPTSLNFLIGTVTDGTGKLQVAGNIYASTGIGLGTVPVSTAYVKTATGTATIAPIIITRASAVLNTGTLQDGAIEVDANHIYHVIGSTRYTLDQQITQALTSNQTTLVAGTVTISLAGVTSSSKGFVSLVTASGTSLTTGYKITCTSGSITITADVAAGTINVSDVSTLNYLVIY